MTRSCHGVPATALALGAAVLVAGQRAAAQPLPLDEPGASSSPGYVVLGVEPLSVPRPAAPAAAALDLVVPASSDVFLPTTLAIEIAPHPLLDPWVLFEEHYEAGLLDSALRTLSLSVAVARPADAASRGVLGTGLAFGGRVVPLAGGLGARLRELREDLLAAEDCLAEAESDAEERACAAEVARLLALWERVSRARTGGFFAIDGAVGLRFPGDRVDAGTVDRWGLWVTPGYRLEAPALEAIALARVARDVRGARSVTLLDLGGRLVWQLERLALSVELVQRLAEEEDPVERDTYRLVGSLEYGVAGSAVAITATVGKDFDRPAIGGENLVAALGLRVAFGRPELE